MDIHQNIATELKKANTPKENIYKDEQLLAVLDTAKEMSKEFHELADNYLHALQGKYFVIYYYGLDGNNKFDYKNISLLKRENMTYAFHDNENNFVDLDIQSDGAISLVKKSNNIKLVYSIINSNQEKQFKFSVYRNDKNDYHQVDNHADLTIDMNIQLLEWVNFLHNNIEEIFLFAKEKEIESRVKEIN